MEARKDIIGFTKRRRTFLPFLQKHEITHPAARVQGGDQNVIILDIDEVGTTGSNSTTTASGGHTAHVAVGSVMFLSVVGLLAFYGTYASTKELIASTKELKELAEEKDLLLQRRKRIMRSLMSGSGKQAALRPHDTMLQENFHMRAKAHVDRVFMGGFGGSGATLVGTSILCNAQMFGAVAPALAVAASPVMFAATPLVTVFGTGIACYEAYRFGKTYRMQSALARVLARKPLGNEALAQRLLQRRLKTVRFVSAVKGASYLGLAIGVPMTVFGGPYGLPLLLASAGGMVTAGILEGALTGYSPQLTLDDKLKLRDTHDYVNAIEHTHGARTLLNALRRDKKLLYPHGNDAFFPMGPMVRGVAAVRRALSKKAKRYASPEITMVKLMHDFAKLDEARAEMNVRAADHRALQVLAAPEDSVVRARELTNETCKAVEELRQMRLEHRLQPFEKEPRVAPEEAAFALMQFLIRSEYLRAFGLQLVKSGKLRTAYMKHRVLTQENNEWHFDANSLVLLFTKPATQERMDMLHTTFALAERALATTGRRNLRSRERHLLDLFSEHATAADTMP